MAENYQVKNLKYMIHFANTALDEKTSFYDVADRQTILKFLDSKIKVVDPEKKWIRTWNDYKDTIKYFYRWLYNIEKENRATICLFLNGRRLPL